jgi:hypothetical protein
MPSLIAGEHKPFLLAWVFAAVIPPVQLFGQDDHAASAPVHTFGFFFSPALCYANPEWPDVSDLPATYADSIPDFLDSPQAGFSLGVLWEHEVKGPLSVRVLPTLLLLNGNLNYAYPDGRAGEVPLERTEAALSAQLLVGGKLPGGARAYMGLGPMIGCDLATDPAAQRIALRWDLGGGVEFRVATFQMGVEVCGSWQPRALPVEPGVVAPTRLVEGLYWNTQSLRLVFKA